MYAAPSRIAACCLSSLVLALGACSPADRDNPARPLAGGVAAAEQPAPPPAPPTLDWNAAQMHIALLVDSADHKLRKIPGLTSEERRRLRRDVNAVQIQRARMLGVHAASFESAVNSGRLVRLEETNQYWVLRELKFSEPYVTPSTEAMLIELGKRFQAQLDSLGLPRYRLDVTSVLRTPEKQAALRRANRNASRIESAHEFGTTLDVAYRKYAPPAEYPDVSFDPMARQVADSLLAENARVRGTELQAILGRVLLDMQREGKVMVIMERSQPVYHMTCARRFQPVRRQG